MKYILICLSVLCSISAGSQTIKPGDDRRDTFPFLPYETYGIAQKSADRWLVSRYYQKQFHSRGDVEFSSDSIEYYVNGCDTLKYNVNYCDSMVKSVIRCDSVLLFVHERQKRIFAPLFSKGIISCQVLNAIRKTLPGLYKYDSLANKYMSVHDAPFETLQITRTELLPHVPTTSKTRILKFRIGCAIFYVELTNDLANRSTTIEDFITGARLTWIFKSPQYVPNCAW